LKLDEVEPVRGWRMAQASAIGIAAGVPSEPVGSGSRLPRLDPSPPTGVRVLLFHAFFRLCSAILSFCRRVILIVARHRFCDLFGGELAVILGMQNVVERTGIRGHFLKAPYLLNVDMVATLLDESAAYAC
jgi:hypothetical protein